MRSLLVATLLLASTPAWADVMPAPAPKLRNTDGYDQAWARVRIGQESSLILSAETTPGHPLTFRAIKLPNGAVLTSEPHPSPRAKLTWTPTEDDIGSAEAIIEISDGHDTVRKTVTYEVYDEWGSGLCPSAGSSVDLSRSGTIVGVPIQVALVMWAYRNSRSGSSHGRFYLQVEPIRTLFGEQRTGAGIGFGFDASFESTPRRRWLIPFYGLTFGSLLNKDLPDGGFGYALPQLGAYLWADHGIFVHASAGWLLPFSAFADHHGLRANLALTFNVL